MNIGTVATVVCLLLATAFFAADLYYRVGVRIRLPKKGVAAILACVALVTLAACGGTPSQQQTDQQNNDAAAKRLHQEYQYPQLTHSNELQNQVTRYQRLNNPSEVAYVYVFSGTLVYGPYQVIGKCSSTESLYSAPQSAIPDPHASTGSVVVPAAQPDGSYGQNEAAIFCFEDDANKTMIEFSQYMGWILVEKPIVGLPTVQGSAVVPNGK